jgi:hypothetical protein
MKKLTLLIALTITLVAKADMEEFGCGWRFKANIAAYYDGKEYSEPRLTNSTFYWNGDCDKLMKFVQDNGEVESYYIKSNERVIEGKNNDGIPYKAFFIYDKKTHRSLVFQVVYDDNGTYVKLIDKTGEYILFK